MLWLLLMLPLVLGCGVTTHSVIAQKALEIQPLSILQQNPNWYYAGSAFPDFGYQCPWKEEYPDLPSASEFAHWQPFQKVALKYYHQHPDDRFLAFLLGVVSHSIADQLWHNLANVYPTHRGFIQSVASYDFDFGNKSYDSYIHGLCDIGGEFVIAKQFDLSFLPTTWNIPVDALSQIFKDQNLTIPGWVIQECMDLLFLETQIFRDLDLDLILDLWIADTEFLIGQIQDWPIGGIYSMSRQSVNCWDALMSNFTIDCPVQPSPIRSPTSGASGGYPGERSEPGRGVSGRPGSSPTSGASGRSPSSFHSVVGRPGDYGYGFSLVLYNEELWIGDYDHPSLAMVNQKLYLGQPGLLTGNGSVAVYDLTRGWITEILGETLYFGSKIFSCQNKLVVSDYLYGKIWIYQNKELIRKLEGEEYSQFGWEILCMNDLLVIGAPHMNNRGAVYLLRKGEVIQMWNGSSVNENFGFSLATDGKVLAVGSPGKSLGEFSHQVGQVNLYDLISGQLIKTFTGEKEYGQFGWKVLLNQGDVYISAPFISRIYRNEEVLVQGIGRLGSSMLINDTTLYLGMPDLGRVIQYVIDHNVKANLP